MENANPHKAPDFNDLVQMPNGQERIRAVNEAAINQVRLAAVTGSSQKRDVYEWQTPEPIKDSLPEVVQFSESLIPQALQAFVNDMADRMQVAPDFIAVPLMVALGSVIGRRIAIRPKRQDDWSEVPNLWGGIVGSPGLMKSPSMAQSLKPLEYLSGNALEGFKQEELDFNKRLLQYDMEKNAIKKSMELRLRKAKDKAARDDVFSESDFENEEPPSSPTLRRYKTDNGTMEALAELLKQNPNGFLVVRDELISLIKHLEDETRATEKAFFMQCWTGQGTYIIDRIGRGFNNSCQCCLSIIGTSQPSVIARYVAEIYRGKRPNDGLFQRFQLLVWPDQSTDWVNIDRYPNADAKNAVYQIFQNLNDLEASNTAAMQDIYPNGEPDGIPYLRFDEEAQAAFKEWRPQLETQIRSGDLSELMEGHIAKFRGLIPRLALITHLVNGHRGAVGLQSLETAFAWSEYLTSHTLRIYESGHQVINGAARSLILHIKRGDLEEGFTARDVYRKGWSSLTDNTIVQEALDLLIEKKYIKGETIVTGGKPAFGYLINPKIGGMSCPK